MKIEFCYINNALRAQQAEPVVVGGWWARKTELWIETIDYY